MKTTNILTGTCKTCGRLIKLDLGDMDKASGIELVKKWESFDCPGRHFEGCSPYPHHWALDEWEVVEGEAAPTEEEFEASLREQFAEVRDTEGMAGLITGFAFGYPSTNDGQTWQCVNSPQGKRWYYRK